ncbi:hypothetical protein O3P69_012059 [Scylla paramamosain]|uniref:Ionotropic glutamate receptor C-terminal domain-containing protein n=1 Tax=Scylla paramamosain TaxID=85552 RepID=A0AAW0SH91_SCYPA
MLAYTTPTDTALYRRIPANTTGLASILFFIERLQRCYIPTGEKPVSMGAPTPYPISSAARVIYWVGYSVSLIVYTSYSATLVSHFAVEQPAPLPFSNLRDLSRQSGWDAGCNNNDLFPSDSLGGSLASAV